MNILALESSATACSAALCRDGALVAQSFQSSGLTHSRTLLPMVHDLLKNCGESLEKVDVIAVAAGPGSFTGLRIGVATAKGLAWAQEKPCAPCSTLESMAWPLAHLQGKLIVCAMDARRRQVYNALFFARGEELERRAPDRAISLEELGEELKNFPEEKIVVGDGAQLCYNSLNSQVSGMTLAPVHLRLQSAWGVARAAETVIAAGGLVPGGALVPVYHRLSQAERERLEREQNLQ
ncbi:tRNA (adenosine(37)-N6)-threonylcarbamoyltransferase complex dimerization subunit type 1 TsaB [Pseudoflavonifractor sp. 60]|uniref:tRNA (adenosine(37)-N6)-threonylcarbamoyltransferase complex dimerization subunit type 1 TsaB n=1 Tax=Pseudoflavonifractor sp. 60 TaxID=2304576 RepID=UPI00136F36B3|nr:tRNA (adenosine(37)-N6)-threonylcarbamoyltransferase complex dimerization subunit type 1 TsaB [Pseudoflavonifractor sp. 60]